MSLFMRPLYAREEGDHRMSGTCRRRRGDVYLLALVFLGACASQGASESETACLETRIRATAGNAEVALALVAAPRRASLRWAGGEATEVAFTLEQPEAFAVSSRKNPDFLNDIAIDCKDHIVLTGKATLRTEDGRIDETWTMAEVRTTATGGAELVHTIDAKDLRGSYRPALPVGHCFKALQLNVSLTADTFSGSTIDTIVDAPCGSNNPQAGASPRQSATWTTGTAPR